MSSPFLVLKSEVCIDINILWTLMLVKGLHTPLRYPRVLMLCGGANTKGAPDTARAVSQGRNEELGQSQWGVS